jgi:hypothetical protein
MESEDDQALDVLSSPTAIRVELVRAMTTGSEAAAEKPERRSDNFFTVALGRAYFWEANSGTESRSNRRVLQGEIDLEIKLKPTFVFPRLSIEVGSVSYFIQLCSRGAHVFLFSIPSTSLGLKPRGGLERS